MLALKKAACINTLYEGGPRMLSCMSVNNALKMISRTLCGFFIGLILSSNSLAFNLAVETDTFGSGSNSFNLDFVRIGYTNNKADNLIYISTPTGIPNTPITPGSVSYTYRLGKYEITKDMIDKANINGGLNITPTSRSTQPFHVATGISWFEAARFVNYLNTSKGYQPAYNFVGGVFTLWDVNNSVSTNNRYRHKDAFYFLPTIDEWWKGAFYDYQLDYYWNFSNRSDDIPQAVASGTQQNTLVYNQPFPWNGGTTPNAYQAGGISALGTMGQSGSVAEWSETAADNTNNSANENKALMNNSSLVSSAFDISSEAWPRGVFGPAEDNFAEVGFRVASIPEPSTSSLILFGTIVVFKLKRFYENT